MVKIAVLISGSGSNLQSLIDNVRNGYINGEIKLVVSSSPSAYGLQRANDSGIRVYALKIRMNF